MSDQPKTLMQMAGLDLTPAGLSEASIVVVDAQGAYADGPLTLPDVAPAAVQIGKLLGRARAAGTPIIHVRHVGGAGSPFDTEGPGFAYLPEAEPAEGEAEIRKNLPNSFAGTDLDEKLKATGRKKVIIVGYMSHMCISATARSALDHGYGATVVAGAAATRPLPSATGDGVVDAKALHDVAMTELSDRFAIIAKSVGDIPD